MKTCVIIPAYNEAGTIAGLVEKIRNQGLEVVVVDDGSKDKTAEIAQKYGAVVLRNRANRGKGVSFAEGIRYSLENAFDTVITMDGDGQHLAEDIPFFIKQAAESKNGIFIGNRMAERRNMPLLRVLTNKFMSWLISRITRQDIPDSQCGFRLIKKEVLSKLNLTTAKYEIETETLLQAARLGFKIESVPIETVYVQNKSYINPFVDSLRFIRFMLKELWNTPN